MLGEAVRSALLDAGAGSTLEACDRAARAHLEAARERPGRVRGSAFALLTADALVTYACEAALEEHDPAAALASLLAVGDRQ
jgi:hypothetical protein